MESQTPKVLVTVLHQGWIRPEMVSILTAMQADSRAQVYPFMVQRKPYEDALNNAVKMCVDGGYDFWITFDHDNVPNGNPIDLILLDKDIIGMPYLGARQTDKGLELAYLAMDKQLNGEYLDHRNMNGLQEVDAVASGALVVARRVLDSGLFFERTWKDGFMQKGIDFYFCEKAKEKGFSVWAHYGYTAKHFKEIDLTEVLAFAQK